jgi:hypothetical protein
MIYECKYTVGDVVSFKKDDSFRPDIDVKYGQIKSVTFENDRIIYQMSRSGREDFPEHIPQDRILMKFIPFHI